MPSPSTRIGVISTTGTHQSRAYLDAFAAAPHLDVTSGACPRFVDFVESGVTSGEEVRAVAGEYLAPFREHDVDTLILGCTHYPLLSGVISYVMGPDVTLVSSADETAKELYRVLSDGDLLRSNVSPPQHGFTTTGNPEEFRRLATRFLGLGPDVGHVFTSPVGVAEVVA